MRTHKAIFILLILLMFSLKNESYSKEKNLHPIDSWLESYMSKEQNQNPLEMSLGYQEAQTKWDSELNKVYKVLMTKLKQNQKDVLKESQKAWLKHRDEEFKFITTSFNRDGSMWQAVVSELKMNVVKSRTLVLKEYIISLDGD